MKPQQSGEGSHKNDDMAEASLSGRIVSRRNSPGTTAAETTLAMTETTVYETLPALSQEEKDPAYPGYVWADHPGTR